MLLMFNIIIIIIRIVMVYVLPIALRRVAGAPVAGMPGSEPDP